MKIKTIFLISTCLASINAFSNSEIIGGEKVDRGDAIARTTVALSDGNMLCTGVIVADDLVVTAAHCLNDAEKMAVIFSTDAFEKESKIAWVNGAAVHPDYRISNDAMNDIAMVGFDGGLPSGYSPVDGIFEADLKNEMTVTLAGYGITDAKEKTGAGILRKTKVRISDARFSKSEFLLDQTQGHGACHGDSGGPAFVKKNGSYQLAGITSRAYPETAKDDCKHGAIYTNVSAFMDFLNSSAKKIRAQ